MEQQSQSRTQSPQSPPSQDTMHEINVELPQNDHVHPPQIQMQIGNTNENENNHNNHNHGPPMFLRPIPTSTFPPSISSLNELLQNTQKQQPPQQQTLNNHETRIKCETSSMLEAIENNTNNSSSTTSTSTTSSINSSTSTSTAPPPQPQSIPLQQTHSSHSQMPPQFQQFHHSQQYPHPPLPPHHTLIHYPFSGNPHRSPHPQFPPPPHSLPTLTPIGFQQWQQQQQNEENNENNNVSNENDENNTNNNNNNESDDGVRDHNKNEIETNKHHQHIPLRYQPVMFPAIIPLNSNHHSIPGPHPHSHQMPLIGHPPPLLTTSSTNVINEDDIFGGKNNVISIPPSVNQPIMIINNHNNHGTNFNGNKNTKKRKRSNNNNDDSDDDEDDYEYDEENDDNNDNLRQPLTKKRRVSPSDRTNTVSMNTANCGYERDGRHFCAYCNKSFVQRCHLSRHIREKHASARPEFECRICNKTFNQRSNLKVHLRSHALDESVSRPWLCTECYPNRRFTRKSSLKRHWVKKHKNISAQLISELDMTVTNANKMIKPEENNNIKFEADNNENTNNAQIQYIKNEPIQQLRYDNGIYRIGDIEIPPEVFTNDNTNNHHHNTNNFAPMIGN